MKRPTTIRAMTKARKKSTEPIRLQKALAQAGVASRRKCESYIVEGRVAVDGVVKTELGTLVTPGVEQLSVDGKPVEGEPRRLFLFHKPSGVTTTLSDPHAEQTLGPLIERLGVRAFPVGRLDRNVVGLLLLTNDGDYAERLLHPRFAIERCYQARIEGLPNKKTLSLLTKGIELEDGLGRAGRVKAKPGSAELRNLLGMARAGESYLEITVTEGRKHFVKRLLRAAGHPVVRLARVQFGPYSLGSLASGQVRESDFLPIE